ncbi:MAG: 4Fe-4S binding protein [Methanobrevibacter sp.]|uniref:tungsten-dependent formylmethanofuran dehydrogenase subunit FwdF n=1 Tax=Methanobrevibacter sp. TaxID=66852 RepID=UPI0025E0E560|nr:tungsten-dependent formylmethanofuran dehydrogenase subunit FwdF [Methanobrevibacter sp.]MBR3112085.1 4Fe-4S binding protein [Methanobrevibacter sp.]MBR3140706.1 4Fe-4S binding protein [Methanobrevibacter sp.]
MFSIERSGEEHRKLAYNSNKCVGCGICTDVCPTSSLRLGPLVPIARGLIEMDLISVNQDSCVFCGLCSVACPFDSLSLSINGEEIKNMGNYPKWETESKVDDDDCMYCGRCNEICPRDSILFERHLPNPADLVRGEIEINKEKCIYCSFCADMCPAGAINIKNIPTSSVDVLNNSIEVDLSKCIFCGVCKRVCPEDAIKQICSTCMLREEIEVPEISGETIILEDSCVNCSWCSEICPVDAITVTKPFEGKLELVENEADDKICKGDSCHACQDVCPCNAVTIVDGRSVTNLDFCNLCGACVTACPQNIRVLTRTGMKLTNINSESWNEILNQLLAGK